MRARGLITAAATIIAVGLATSPVQASGDVIEIPPQDWSFSGVFGTSTGVSCSVATKSIRKSAPVATH